LGKRQTRSYGWTYDFDTGRFAKGEPMPAWLADVRDEVAERVGLLPDELAQALLIRYDPGAGIGWHRDRPIFEHVVGLSLGNPATLRFRTARGFERFSLEAEPRSIYRLSGEARRDWEHSIAEMDVPRRSITFRTLAP
jgi:DNA oxidative demethylase